jgi:hypothetical protein
MNIISLLNLIIIIVIIIVLFKINNDINKIKIVHDEKEENIDVTLNKVYNNQLYFNEILDEIIDIMNNSTTEKEKNMLLKYLNEQLNNYKNSRDSESYINSPIIEFFENADNSQVDLKDKLKKISDLIEDNKSKQEDLKKLVKEIIPIVQDNIKKTYDESEKKVFNLIKQLNNNISNYIEIDKEVLKFKYDINNINFCKKENGNDICYRIKPDSLEQI